MNRKYFLSFKYIFSFYILFLLVTSNGHAAPSPTLKICINAKGQISAKAKCPKGQTFSATTLSQFVGTAVGSQGLQGPQGPKGDKGDAGIAGAGALVVDGTKTTEVPPCFPDFINPGLCFISGLASATATCPNNTRPFAVLCISKPNGGSTTVTQGSFSSNGGQCGFSNFSFTPLVGEFYTRVHCISAPAF